MKLCEYCGEPFEPARNYQKYCGPECYANKRRDDRS